MKAEGSAVKKGQTRAARGAMPVEAKTTCAENARKSPKKQEICSQRLNAAFVRRRYWYV